MKDERTGADGNRVIPVYVRGRERPASRFPWWWPWAVAAGLAAVAYVVAINWQRWVCG